MKKYIAILLLVCSFAFCLSACGGNSETGNQPEKTAEEKVEDLICSIEDADSCYEAAKAFYLLSPENQAIVCNAADLKNEMKKYKSDSRIRDYLMEELAAAKHQEFHNDRKKQLLNINSYTVNSESAVVYYDEARGSYYLELFVDYSAQNKMGGYERLKHYETYIWSDYSASWGLLYYNGNEQIFNDLTNNRIPEYTRYNFKYSAD